MGRARRPGTKGRGLRRMKWRISLKRTTDIKPESTGEMNQDPTVNRNKCFRSQCTVQINALFRTKQLAVNTYFTDSFDNNPLSQQISERGARRQATGPTRLFSLPAVIDTNGTVLLPLIRNTLFIFNGGRTQSRLCWTEQVAFTLHSS